MHRLKFLLGTVFLLIVLTFSIAGAVKPEPATLHHSEAIEIKPKVPTKEDRIFAIKKKEVEKAITSYFNNAMRNDVISGAGVSIVKGDSILFSNGFGKRKAKLKDSINAETVFRLGSLSKGFTGVLAGLFVKDGLLEWDSKVEDYIDDFQLGPIANTSKVTFANLLSHTSGASYHSYTNLVEAGLDLEDISKRFKNINPIAQPGELYSYQNAIFALSGTMMEKAAGKSINTLFKEHLFLPLGMKNTSTDYKTFSENKNIAFPHRKLKYGWTSKSINQKYYNAVTAGGINASAQDMSKWMRFLLGHNSEIANKAVLNAIFKLEIEIKGSAKYYQRWPGHISSHYAHGWRLHEYRDKATGETEIMRHHGGAVSGFRNEIALYPTEDLGICVLFNTNTPLAKTVIPELHKLVQEILAKPITIPDTNLIASTNH
ncbi:serine hydrolase domain-containing protein [Flavimarina sp. Hel_I_48]|uniref:serine hydrolase domain-containing protein n=1 Tax=Flavimarina sp. Hel_I_48 TaxID=1392488 RepID=UPI00068FF8AE|nr:serine hydrolase domain-containing protein [Flavimarina sp. Hel_I_48]